MLLIDNISFHSSSKAGGCLFRLLKKYRPERNSTSSGHGRNTLKQRAIASDLKDLSRDHIHEADDLPDN